MPASSDRCDQGALKTQKLLGQFGICTFQKESRPPVHHILPGEKEAETGLEIVVRGDFIIEAQALRTGPDQACRQKAHHTARSLDHRRAAT